MRQHLGRFRTAIAFVIAPAAGALALSVVVFIFFSVTTIFSPIESIGWNVLRLPVVIFAFAILPGVFISMIGGGPIFLLIRNRVRVKLLHSMSIGAILGALSIPVFSVTFGKTPMDAQMVGGFVFWVFLVPIGLFCGTVGGAVFWWIVYGGRRSNTNENPTTVGGSTNGDGVPLNETARKD